MHRLTTAFVVVPVHWQWHAGSVHRPEILLVAAALAAAAVTIAATLRACCATCTFVFIVFVGLYRWRGGTETRLTASAVHVENRMLCFNVGVEKCLMRVLQQ
jgi:hypothetical protein